MEPASALVKTSRWRSSTTVLLWYVAGRWSTHAAVTPAASTATSSANVRFRSDGTFTASHGDTWAGAAAGTISGAALGAAPGATSLSGRLRTATTTPRV